MSFEPRTDKDPRQNSFPVAWRDWTTDADLKRILNGLVEELGISLRLTGMSPAAPASPPGPDAVDGVPPRRRRGRPPDPKPYHDVAYRLLLNLFRVANADPAAWVGYSRTESDYTDRTCLPESVSYYRLVKVVEWVAGQGWAELEDGYFDWNAGYGWQSLIRATPPLTDRLSGLVPMIVQAPLEDRELIRLKDADKVPVSDYADTPELVRWRANLRQINKHIAGSKLGFALTLRQKLAMVSDLRKRKCAPDLSRIQLYRPFNDGRWDRGGRFYGGWWINLPKQYRQHITINDEPTVELDFSSYHLSMVYGLEGLEVPEGDLYDIGWDESLPPEESYRPMVKKFVNALLYANTEDSAIQAMQDFRKDDIRALWKRYGKAPHVRQHGMEGGLLVPMLQAIKRKHAPVVRHFGVGDSTRLQFADSEIAEQLLLWCCNTRCTALPVHDSFIVPRWGADAFESQMIALSYAYIGSAVPIKF
jgi:hypothetical protein